MDTLDAARMSRDMISAVAIDLIDPDPEQPRKHFDDGSIEELAASMASIGLSAPILLRPAGDRYVIVTGERRYRAAVSLAWPTIPAIVRDLEPDHARWVQLTENIARADLTPIEEARAFAERLDLGMTQTELAKTIGKTQSYIAQKLRLLKMPAPLIAWVARGALSEGHVRQLLKVKGVYADAAASPAPFGPPPTDAAAPDWSDQATVAQLFREIRPEDYPPAWIGMSRDIPQEVLDHLAAGCAALDQSVHAGGVTTWEPAACWFGGLAIATHMSVADLSDLINAWRDRLYSAIGSWCMFPDTAGFTGGEEPRDLLARHRYWGYRSDLRHAGLPTDRGNLEQHPDLLIAAVKRVCDLGYLVLPSILQPWSPQSEQYREIEQKREQELIDMYGYVPA